MTKGPTQKSRLFLNEAIWQSFNFGLLGTISEWTNRTGRPAVRIFLGVTEVAGRASGLHEGLTELGADPKLFIIHEDRFGFLEGVQNLPAITRVSQWFYKISKSNKWHTSWISLLVRIPVLSLISLATFFESLRRYDAYYFQFGISTLPWNLDLFILRILRRRVIVVLGHGSELRPPWLQIAPPVGGADDAKHGRSLRKIERAKKRLAHRMEFLCVEIIACPTTDHYLSKPYWDIVRLGRPARLDHIHSRAWTQLGTAPEEKIILHVPSKSQVKGTGEVIKVMKKVCELDPSFSFRLLSGISRSDFLKEMASSFAVIDQVYSDIPFSATAFEAGFLGLPCISGGGWMPFWKGRIPQREDNLPFHVNNWHDPEELLSILQDTKSLLERANNVKRLLAQDLSPHSSSVRYLSLFKGQLSKTYKSNATGEYISGFGINQEQVYLNLESIVKWKSSR